ATSVSARWEGAANGPWPVGICAQRRTGTGVTSRSPAVPCTGVTRRRRSDVGILRTVGRSEAFGPPAPGVHRVFSMPRRRAGRGRQREVGDGPREAAARTQHVPHRQYILLEARPAGEPRPLSPRTGRPCVRLVVGATGVEAPVRAARPTPVSVL